MSSHLSQLAKQLRSICLRHTCYNTTNIRTQKHEHPHLELINSFDELSFILPSIIVKKHVCVKHDSLLKISEFLGVSVHQLKSLRVSAQCKICNSTLLPLPNNNTTKKFRHKKLKEKIS